MRWGGEPAAARVREREEIAHSNYEALVNGPPVGKALDNYPL
jgi:hypothetical protein